MIKIIFKFMFGGSAGEEMYHLFLGQMPDNPVVLLVVVCCNMVFALFLVVCFYQFIRSMMGRKGR